MTEYGISTIVNLILSCDILHQGDVWNYTWRFHCDLVFIISTIFILAIYANFSWSKDGTKGWEYLTRQYRNSLSTLLYEQKNAILLCYQNPYIQGLLMF